MTQHAAEAAQQQGDWARAAHLWEDAGEPGRAAELYARLLQFADAARAHLAAGQLTRGVLAAARAGSVEAEGHALDHARRHGDPATLAATARALEDLGRTDLAAPLWDAAGDVESAARAHEAAGQLHTAARRWLACGNHRNAGVLLERHLLTHPTDAAAMLELGTVLGRFGKHDNAAVLFRRAASDTRLTEAALRRLAVTFWAQGHPHAAERVLEELAEVAPHAPRDMLTLAALEREPAGGTERAGTRIDRRYLLVRPLSAGSLGDTYLAHDEFTDRRVQLTLFRPSVVQSHALRQYAAVRHAAQSLALPELVALLEFNLAQGFVASALPSGVPLEEALRRGLVTQPDRVVRAVGTALEALHRRGLHHGALHPGCVHVSDVGLVQVGDVGAGLLLALRETESLGLDSALATLAPEVVGGGMPGPPADQYALAAITYRLVAGAWPASSTSPRYRPVQDPVANAALVRALSSIPSERFPTVAAFLGALPQVTGTVARSLPPNVEAAPQGPRLQHDAPPQVAGMVRWQPHTDTTLGRRVWVASGAPGSLAAFRVVAPLVGGLQRVLELSLDASRAVFDEPVRTPGMDPHQALLLLAQAARALETLHAQALSLGEHRTRHLTAEGPPVLLWHGLPPPSAGGAAEQALDVARLRSLAVPLLPPGTVAPEAASAGPLAAWLAAQAQQGVAADAARRWDAAGGRAPVPDDLARLSARMQLETE